MSGKEIWDSAMRHGQGADLQFTVRHCFYAIGIMIAEAESSAVNGTALDAVHKLRELQAHCEKLINIMSPDQKGRPRLVDAA